MSIYAICDALDNVLALYTGDSSPNISPFVLISEADYNMANTNPESFKAVNNTLIPLENQMHYLRLKRDFLLKESDKYMLADYPNKNITREEWCERVIQYRQELRDFPLSWDLHNPIFPTPPTED